MEKACTQTAPRPSVPSRSQPSANGRPSSKARRRISPPPSPARGRRRRREAHAAAVPSLKLGAQLADVVAQPDLAPALARPDDAATALVQPEVAQRGRCLAERVVVEPHDRLVVAGRPVWVEPFGKPTDYDAS